MKVRVRDLARKAKGAAHAVAALSIKQYLDSGYVSDRYPDDAGRVEAEVQKMIDRHWAEHERLKVPT